MNFSRSFALAMCLAALHCSHDESASGPVQFSGFVVDSDGQPLPNARVVQGTSSNAAQTDGTGKFELTYIGHSGDPIALVASAPGYAPNALLTTAPGSGTLSLVLRRRDVIATVSMPAPGAADLEVGVPNALGTASVGIPAGALVDANGQEVKGDVQVEASYWAPGDDHTSAPAILWAVEADESINKLLTYGMMDVAFSQAGQSLQVTPGKSITLTMPIDPSQLADYAADAPNKPAAYSVDANTGLWRWEAGIDSTAARLQNLANVAPIKIITSPVNGTASVVVNRPNAWNIDIGLTSRAGGCLSGTLVDACGGKSLPNTPFTLWFLGIEEVAKFNGTSNGAGNFCLATPYSTFGTDPTNGASVNYIVSALNDVSKTAMCNPAANLSECFAARPVKVAGTNQNRPGFQNFSAPCRLSDLNTGAGPVLHRYFDTCTPRTSVAIIRPCTWCSGSAPPASCAANGAPKPISVGDGSCFSLGKLAVPGANCTCDKGKCHPKCHQRANLGSACYVDPTVPGHGDGYEACCSTDPAVPYGSLICRDSVCIDSVYK